MRTFIQILITCIVIGCGAKDEHRKRELLERLNTIEENMLQDSESIVSLLGKLDTTEITAVDAARINTIKGLSQLNKGESRNCISNLEKAESVFIHKGDDYHLYINKLIRAFAFEYLRLDNNATKLYVECDTFFSNHELKQLRFYSSLGMLRYSKYLNVNKEKLKQQISRDIILFDNPIYEGIYYSSLEKIENNDSIRIIYLQKAIVAFTKAEYWSRVFAVELNLLFMKIKQDNSGSMQENYNLFFPKKYHYSPTQQQKLRYRFAQAYLYERQGKYEDAIIVANSVLEDAAILKIFPIEADCTEILAYLYKQNKNYKKALYMMEKFRALESKKIDDLKRNQLLALGAHYKYSELEKDKITLNMKIQRSILIIVVITLLLFILIIIGWRLKQLYRHKQEKLQLEKIKIQEQVDTLLQSFRQAKVENEELISKMEDVKYRYDKSLRISELIKSVEQNEIKNWMDFETHFSLLLPGWIEKLKQEAPTLTQIDIKYCMCIYFNMNNSEISKLCFVGAEAIKSAKKRIRDKLLLTDATEIYAFLKKL